MKTECETCGGKGRLYTDHRHYVAPRDDGLCDECNGTGWATTAQETAETYIRERQAAGDLTPLRDQIKAAHAAATAIGNRRT